MPSPHDLASPVVIHTNRMENASYVNEITGGLTKRQEIATRICQGLMGYAISEKGRPVDPKIVVGMSFGYADLLLSDDFQSRVEEPSVSNPPGETL